jgi:dUTP pyrophosphatase
MGNRVKVKVINRSDNPLPEYGTAHAAGMDIRAWVQQEQEVIAPGEVKLIHTGLYIELPVGYEAQIRPRSGLALKQGVTVLNTPGTIDADYRGEVGIILINHGKEDFVIRNGERICQMIISKHETAEWEETDSLEETERGTGGFGHTGK